MDLSKTLHPGVGFAAVMSVIIAAGRLARLMGLDDLLIWHDEAFTLIRVFGYAQEEVNQGLFNGQLLTPAQVLQFQESAGRGWSDTFKALAQHPEHAPLYYVLGRLFTALPLDPVTALRAASAVFGALLPVAVFWLMRALFGRGPVPWVAAALIACSPLHFLYAQEARQYAIWTLAVVASSAALQQALAQGRRAGWWLYGALIAAGLYAHLLFALMLPVHAAYAWLFRAHASGSLLRPRGLPVKPWGIAVVAAVVLFLPWILVFLIKIDRAASYTSWMERPIGLDRNLLSWAVHLFRAHVDLHPAEPPRLLLLLLLPLAWAVWHFLRRAPRPAVWLLPLMALGYIGVVLGPDLLFGGSRSSHVRYALPAILAIQLMLAWTIGNALMSAAPKQRAVAMASLSLLLGLGLLSLVQIQRADTWWTKNFSSANIEIARLADNADNPLVAASPSGVGTGEMISLAYHLDPNVRLWGDPMRGQPVLPDGFGDIILLTPTDQLRAAASAGREVEPVADSWQWLMARTAAGKAERTAVD